ncbi:transcription initiation factor IIF, beta subunit-domain-containing protein [Clohesyomyces aquaticus]|uniref:Transcription initiation factor IIF subunit beta n=1 Tax=Clohesyomyces aquaticus TaxID=1231657 RepID=A0A1Y1YQL2_9PLEO|nr:transcription initiation factor IIF, beta subunit-domain-containing protein [Clohesyomyces aquaticus]
MNGFKQEDVKMENDAGTPSGSGYMDDEFYEDTGELQLPDPHKDRDIWLTRIPKWLFEKVSKWDDLADLAEGDDNELVQIGEMLIFPDHSQNGKASKTEPMRMFLSDRWAMKAGVPRAFELSTTPATKEQMANTYIFTEKDLPGYKPNGYNQNYNFNNSNKGGFGGFGGGGGGVQDPKARIYKRGKYRKAIPKHTALLGPSTREYIANPIPTPEFLEFERKRTYHAIQGANTKTNIIESVSEVKSAERVQNMFRAFIKPAAPKKSQINKAARIPKNELIDLLHSKFDEFAFWPMKALKKATKQPEAYLKEVLTDIADLVKTGSFAACWRRQDMYNTNAVQQKMDRPPDVDDDDEDDEVEMEDVV